MLQVYCGKRNSGVCRLRGLVQLVSLISSSAASTSIVFMLYMYSTPCPGHLGDVPCCTTHVSKQQYSLLHLLHSRLNQAVKVACNLVNGLLWCTAAAAAGCRASLDDLKTCYEDGIKSGRTIPSTALHGQFFHRSCPHNICQSTMGSITLRPLPPPPQSPQSSHCPHFPQPLIAHMSSSPTTG